MKIRWSCCCCYLVCDGNGNWIYARWWRCSHFTVLESAHFFRLTKLIECQTAQKREWERATFYHIPLEMQTIFVVFISFRSKKVKKSIRNVNNSSSVLYKCQHFDRLDIQTKLLFNLNILQIICFTQCVFCIVSSWEILLRRSQSKSFSRVFSSNRLKVFRTSIWKPHWERHTNSRPRELTVEL